MGIELVGLIFRRGEIRQRLDSSPGPTRFILAQPPTSLLHSANTTRFRLRVIPNLASERRVPPAFPAHPNLSDAGWASPQLPITHPRRSAYLELLKATGHALAVVNDRHLDSVRCFSLLASLSQTDALAFLQAAEWPPHLDLHHLPSPFQLVAAVEDVVVVVNVPQLARRGRGRGRQHVIDRMAKIEIPCFRMRHPALRFALPTFRVESVDVTFGRKHAEWGRSNA